MKQQIIYLYAAIRLLRNDIAVPFVTTYAYRYVQRTYFYKLYAYATAFVTAGTVCPAALYDICFFVEPQQRRLRNGGFCESRRHISSLNNLQPHQQRCAHIISNPNILSNSNSTHHCVSSNFLHPFPSWRRYTFLRVRLRNQRFLPHPQKNWSPLRAAYTYLYINYYAHIHKIVLFLQLYTHLHASVAAGIRCDDRNNDVLPPYMTFIFCTTPPTTLHQ